MGRHVAEDNQSLVPPLAPVPDGPSNPKPRDVNRDRTAPLLRHRS
jgi:hypothetical protein